MINNNVFWCYTKELENPEPFQMRIVQVSVIAPSMTQHTLGKNRSFLKIFTWQKYCLTIRVYMEKILSDSLRIQIRQKSADKTGSGSAILTYSFIPT